MGHHYCDKVIDFTDPDGQNISILSRYLSQYRGVVACGLPGAGKTHSMRLVMGAIERKTMWDRGKIFSMLLNDVNDFSFMSIVQAFEKQCFDKLLAAHDHPICFEGWLTSSRGRAEVKRLYGSWPVVLLVFDAPVQVLEERVKRGENPYWPAEEISTRLEILADSFQRPTKHEGWREVIYVNTCGGAGYEHMQDLLNI